MNECEANFLFTLSEWPNVQDSQTVARLLPYTFNLKTSQNVIYSTKNLLFVDKFTYNIRWGQCLAGGQCLKLIWKLENSNKFLSVATYTSVRYKMHVFAHIFCIRITVVGKRWITTFFGRIEGYVQLFQFYNFAGESFYSSLPCYNNPYTKNLSKKSFSTRSFGLKTFFLSVSKLLSKTITHNSQSIEYKHNQTAYLFNSLRLAISFT